MGAYLVDFSLKRERNSLQLEAFVDTDEGVTTDLCAQISRDLSPMLDKVAGLQQRYYLVVSSPGLDRPLRFPRQYARNKGRTLVVSVRTGMNREKVEGELVEVKESAIVLKLPEETPREIPFDGILEAHVKLPW